MDKNDTLAILDTLVWDADTTAAELYPLVQGTAQSAGGFTQETLFLRTLERVAWHNLVPLWGGIQRCNQLYTKQIERGLRNNVLRQKYHFLFGLLRGEPVQAPRWGSDYCESLRRTFLSDRWNRA